MIKNLYIVKDNLTNEFTTLPFASANDMTAKRDIKVAFNNPTMKIHANDSILYKYGVFDTESGFVTCELVSLGNVGGIINE